MRFFRLRVADLGEADRGQGILGFHAGPQRDPAQHDVQLRPLHQAQRGYAVRRLRQPVRGVKKMRGTAAGHGVALAAAYGVSRRCRKMYVYAFS